ncbi:MAG: DUF2079 domain-containing protein [Ancrocorticia sp.]|uniref:DUF2079 domain-containing protein n=1 Tax=Ancrocorticia sp. TaxID=2593684 RepID=UPI003F8E45FA
MKNPGWIIAGIAAALYCSFSVFQWNGFVSPSWDLGIFTQLANQYAHLDAPIVDIKGPGYNLLGDHFHPILVLLGPVFRFFPSGLTLLIVQNLLFAWSAVPITRLACQKLGTAWGATLGTSYVLSWGLLEAIGSQFHEIAFAVPLLAFGLVHWIEGKKRAYVEIGLLVFIKEDLGLTVAAFGCIMLWDAWAKAGPQRTLSSLKASLTSPAARHGIYVALWGTFWFAASILIILPLINPAGQWDYTDRLSETEGASAGPLGFIQHFFSPAQKYATLALLVGAAGIIGLRSPLMWLMIPTLLWRFAGNVPYYWGWEWHYSAILMPIAVISLIHAAPSRSPSPRPAPAPPPEPPNDATEGAAPPSSSLTTHFSPRHLAALGISFSLLTNLAMAWTGPVGAFARGTYYQFDQSAGEGAVDAVGTGRSVVTDIRMLSYVVPGNTVYWEGTVGAAQVDTAVISPGHKAHSARGGPGQWAADTFGGTWRTTYEEGGFAVMERVA